MAIKSYPWQIDFALLLLPVEGEKEDTFRRVGIAELPYDEGFKADGLEMRDVTII
jgi:hypothetical protein